MFLPSHDPHISKIDPTRTTTAASANFAGAVVVTRTSSDKGGIARILARYLMTKSIEQQRWHKQCRVGALLVRVAARGPSLVVARLRGDISDETDPMPLDRAVLPLLARLWAHGITTVASCSGHWDADEQRYTSSWIRMQITNAHAQKSLYRFVRSTLGPEARLPAGVRLNWGWEGASYVQAPRIMEHGAQMNLMLRIDFDRRLTASQAIAAHRAAVRHLMHWLDVNPPQ